MWQLAESVGKVLILYLLFSAVVFGLSMLFGIGATFGQVVFAVFTYSFLRLLIVFVQTFRAIGRAGDE